MTYLSEAAIEQLILDQLGTFGYALSADAEIGPVSSVPAHGAYADFLLPMLMEGEVRIKDAEKFNEDAQ
ncbi:hypothetical protein [Aquidulcibacter paucihalophilus]|uniref:hypothetical protein n=1 Tax=Aquidulcibacter paucihalophilus TaxID=1978549 RepID=UPI000A18ECBE|nr:hypothetical protein [Aquidulcibacter paucihalophilus]